VRDALLRKHFERQGAHPDPADPASTPPEWPDWAKPLRTSASYKAFAAVMQTPAHSDIRTAVLHELSTYWQRSLEETLDRCINAEDYSVAEWKEGDRSTNDGLLAFYQMCESWAYLLLWYDYLRACGYSVPAVVDCSEWLSTRVAPGTHLDFGAGVGTASMMFHQLGWQSTVSDVSMPLLDFARWRAAQRGMQIGALDLREPLPANAFDVVTAIDTFAHVPNVHESAVQLHRAMRPGGYLFADYDVREQSEHNAWHLYSQRYGLEWDVRRAGFRHVGAVNGGRTQIYQREERNSLRFRLHIALVALKFGPPSRIYWRSRRGGRVLAENMARRIWRKHAAQLAAEADATH
jgi:2-polyprenyl-3-methyl-5-hydroxy-6-metoxy-1,4-benzoquinol methylase